MSAARPGEVVRTIGLWALLVLCVGGWVLPQRSIDFRRGRWPIEDSLLFLPSGQYMQATSLGFQTVLADGIYLWSLQYYGHHRSAEGRRYIWRIFDVITDLDPLFLDAYLTGALVMATDMSDPELALDLLDKGAAKNPGEWLLPMEAGYYCWLDLEDFARASEYFELALAVPGSPATLRRILAGMNEYAGDKTRALSMWLEIHDAATADGDERVVDIAWQHTYDLKIEIDMGALEAAIAQYRTDRGRPPGALENLLQTGYISGLPVTPAGARYSYDPVTGRVADPRDSQSRADR